MDNHNPYIPDTGKIIQVRDLTEKEKFFQIELPKPLGAGSCQFIMASLPGVGEAPISITCGPRKDNILELVIRKAGGLTQAFHSLIQGSMIGIRGPYGKGLDFNLFKEKDLIIVCGGLGLAPMRSLIIPVMENADLFGKIILITGAKSPAEVLFRDELEQWSKKKNVTVIKLVDNKNNLPWDGEIGLVTGPISRMDIDSKKSVAVLCGPPIMYKFVIMELLAKKLTPAQIYVDLERRMRCGLGKCGHCQINHLYCCCDGPVFNYGEIIALQEAL